MISGIVIHGDAIGRQLGYPTANLNLSPAKTHLDNGVYAAKALLNDVEYGAALLINGDHSKVEVHLLEYHGPEFYGSYLSVEAIQKVSELEYYEDNEELKQKIGRDIEAIKTIV